MEECKFMFWLGVVFFVTGTIGIKVFYNCKWYDFIESLGLYFSYIALAMGLTSWLFALIMFALII